MMSGNLRQTMTTGVGAAAAAALLLVMMVAGGCGYKAGELFPDTYRSVAVPIFENRTFYRGVERDLTEALVKELQQRTPYALATPAAADTVLQGTITRVEQDMLSRQQPGAAPAELEVAVTVNFEWKDLRTGEVITDRRGLVAVGRYVPASPVGESLEVGVRTAVERLADEIVSAMRQEW